MEAQRNHQTTWRAGIGGPDAFSVRKCGVNEQYPLIRVTVVDYLRLCIGDGGIRLYAAGRPCALLVCTANEKKPPCGGFFLDSGGDGGIRTHDTGISRMHP